MRILVLAVLALFWASCVDAAESGQVAATTLRSRSLRNSHDIWVYTPPGYSEQAQAYPLLIVFDGQAYISDESVHTPKILDQLINAGEIRPTLTVFISSGEQKRRNKELLCYEPFARFVSKDVLGYMHKHYNVSSDPADVVVAGSSYGGLAAAYVAFLHSDQIGNVLSQSGAFYWALPKCDRNPSYLIRQYRRSECLPVRFHLEAGNWETEGRNSVLAVNRQMQQVLRAKGYDVSYQEFKGGHEYKYWRETLSEGLKVLLAPSCPTLIEKISAAIKTVLVEQVPA